MKFLKAAMVGLMLVVAVNLSACFFGGGHDTTVVARTTLGQELRDLDDAYKRGIITLDEYQATRKRIIDQRTAN